MPDYPKASPRSLVMELPPEFSELLAEKHLELTQRAEAEDQK